MIMRNYATMAQINRKNVFIPGYNHADCCGFSVYKTADTELTVFAVLHSKT